MNEALILVNPPWQASDVSAEGTDAELDKADEDFGAEMRKVISDHSDVVKIAVLDSVLYADYMDSVEAGSPEISRGVEVDAGWVALSFESDEMELAAAEIGAILGDGGRDVPVAVGGDNSDDSVKNLSFYLNRHKVRSELVKPIILE